MLIWSFILVSFHTTWYKEAEMSQNINYWANKSYFDQGSVIFAHFHDNFFHCVESKSRSYKILPTYYSAPRNLSEKLLYLKFSFWSKLNHIVILKFNFWQVFLFTAFLQGLGTFRWAKLDHMIVKWAKRRGPLVLAILVKII